MLDFTKMDINTIATGVRSDGIRYLRLFWQEYTSIFNEKVNPGCPKCLTTCVNKYKKYFNEMASETQYKLKQKYENIPLRFGSSVLVNNNNITEAYAKELLARPNGERFFAQMPEPTPQEPIQEQPAKEKSGRKKRTQAGKKTATVKEAQQQAEPQTKEENGLPNAEQQ